uniref:Oxidation resistance 1 n=1 Tax=Ficedula albicollis TaxID=59894 RepID=A0A803VN75_FICAL
MSRLWYGKKGRKHQPVNRKCTLITTREDTNSKQATNIKTDLEPEAFRPNLSDPSELLQPEQIEKLTKSLPPRTIGYPWTLVYSTAKHGMSLKTLYRTMMGLDTPVLLVIKDSDGQVFGALASEPFKVSDGFYGTGETFMFTFSPDFEVSSNDFVCFCPLSHHYPKGMILKYLRDKSSCKSEKCYKLAQKKSQHINFLAESLSVW